MTAIPVKSQPALGLFDCNSFRVHQRQQILYRPDAIGEAGAHSWRHLPSACVFSQRGMDPHIVVREKVEGYGVDVVLRLARVCSSKPSKALAVLSGVQVQVLDVGR